MNSALRNRQARAALIRDGLVIATLTLAGAAIWAGGYATGKREHPAPADTAGECYPAEPMPADLLVAGLDVDGESAP